MSIAYYKQDEDNPDLVLVCPYDGSELLVSEYGETYICQDNHHEVGVFDAMTRQSYRLQRSNTMEDQT